MYNRLKKTIKILFITFLLFIGATNKIYADPDPGLCPNPLDPFELIDCNDIDLPIDDSLYVLMALSIGFTYFILRKNKTKATSSSKL
ncbi:MAG: hypothetical protein EAZ51_01005 [Sphingobacteriales bacterium]|nr:MAG: hypothetical protein EAZ64_01535 [Sphingobacteriales bacterium]TAF83131.1 MAG: hypothetical protein EAZ51_01005 [Sphingobacteriales bacterium]